MKRVLVLLALFIFSFSTFSGPKYEVNGIDIKNNNGQIKLEVKLSSNTEVRHKAEIRDNFIQLELTDTFVWPKIDLVKEMKGVGKVQLMAYQFNGKTVRVRAIFPSREILKSSNVVIDKIKKNLVATVKIKSFQKVPEIEAYDESYLNQLIEEKNNKGNIANDFNDPLKDSVSLKTSGQKKPVIVDPLADGNQGKRKEGLGISGYVFKFFGFLIFLIGIIYGCVFFLKKGYVKKNKLGFLNSSELIKVLATHHLDPKKSLMIVSAGKQVFLLSSSESGISKLSELNDPMSFFKNGEVDLFGTNFENSIEESSGAELEELKEKKNIKESTPVNLNDHSISTITDKIKNRVKGMKDFQ